MKSIVTRVLIVVFAASFSLYAHASETNGTIDATNKYAWGENVGWVNFAPQNNSTYSGLVITDTAVTGYGWSKEFGWINFSPTNSGQGVINTSEGHLSGKAWISSLGWLDMSGVTINASGKFTGTAGTEGGSVGRVSFDCTNCNVVTDWRPVSVRKVITIGSGGCVPGTSCGSILPPPPNSNQTPPATTINTTASGNTFQTDSNTKNERKGTQSNDYVESHDTPLIIQPYQHGLLTYDFGNGVGVSISVPKGASTETLTIEVSVSPAIPGDDGPFTYIFGGVKFNIIAKNSHGDVVHNFSAPILISLLLPENMKAEKDLGVYWKDTTLNEWVQVPGVVFTDTTALFSVDHLTLFALIKAKNLPDKIPLGATAGGTPSGGYLNKNVVWILIIILLGVIYWLYYKQNRRQHKH